MQTSVQQPSDSQPNIVRTERGLTISGTKTTLYDVLDYLQAQYPPIKIREKLKLSKAQINAAFAYIEAYRSELDAEYREILQMAENNLSYLETHRHKRLVPAVAISNELDQAALRVKLQAWKNKLSVTV
ncbi:MAG: DUF433 domain-containing protein [Cyanobacteria bacterium P01_F01_bin.53]